MRRNNLFTKITLLTFSACLVGIAISGCQSQERSPYTKEKNSSKVFAQARESAIDNLGSYIKKLPSKKNRLMIISIPKQNLFYSNSANLTRGGVDILRDVTQLLKHYPKEDVQIINQVRSYRIRARNYTNQRKINLALTKRQAGNVARFLRHYKAGAPIIYANTPSPSVDTFVKGADGKRSRLSSKMLANRLVITFVGL